MDVANKFAGVQRYKVLKREKFKIISKNSHTFIKIMLNFNGKRPLSKAYQSDIGWLYKMYEHAAKNL